MRLTDLVKGQWYFSRAWDDPDKLAFKFDNCDGGYTNFEEAIRKGKGYFTNGFVGGCWSNTDAYEPCPQHTLDNYLPVGHPDRSGSEVRINTDDWYPTQGTIVVKLGGWGSLLKEGDITIITFYGNHEGVIKLMTPELDKIYPTKGGWFTKDMFRIATAEEVSAYRAKQIENQLMPKQESKEIVVGCWVKRVEYKHGLMEVGDIAEVASINRHCVKTVNCGTYSYDKKYLERIPEKEIPIHMSNYTPKIGDWVVITKSSKNWNSSSMDKYDGRVVQITEMPYPGKIKFKDSGEWEWRLNDGHFREALSWEISVFISSNITGVTTGNMTASGWIPQIGDWVVRTNGLNFGMRAGDKDQIVGFTPEDKNFILKRYTAPRSSTKPRGHAPAKFRQARPDELPIGAKPYTPPAQIVQQEAGRVDRNPHKIIPLYISPDPEPAPEFERSVPLIYIKHR